MTLTGEGASRALTGVPENLYLRIGKTLSVKERSGQGLVAQGKTPALLFQIN